MFHLKKLTLISTVVLTSTLLIACSSIPGLPSNLQTMLTGPIFNQVNKLLGDELPLNIDINTAFPEVSPPANFNPRQIDCSTDNARMALAPGDYTCKVATFCMNHGAGGPGRGIAFKLGALQGKQATAMSAMYARGAFAGTSHQALQSISWSMQSSLPVSQMPAEHQAIVRQLIPEYVQSFEGDFLRKIESTLSSIPGAPSVDSLLSKAGGAGQTIQEIRRSREMIKQNAHNYQALTQWVSATETGNSVSPWAQISQNVIAQLVIEGGYSGLNQFNFRVLPRVAQHDDKLNWQGKNFILTSSNENEQPLQLAISPDSQVTSDVSTGGMSSHNKLTPNGVTGAGKILCTEDKRIEPQPRLTPNGTAGKLTPNGCINNGNAGKLTPAGTVRNNSKLSGYNTNRRNSPVSTANRTQSESTSADASTDLALADVFGNATSATAGRNVKPNTPAPNTPDTPDTPAPNAPDTPDTPAPNAPDTPDTPAPNAPSLIGYPIGKKVQPLTITMPTGKETPPTFRVKPDRPLPHDSHENNDSTDRPESQDNPSNNEETAEDIFDDFINDMFKDIRGLMGKLFALTEQAYQFFNKLGEIVNPNSAIIYKALSETSLFGKTAENLGVNPDSVNSLFNNKVTDTVDNLNDISSVENLINPNATKSEQVDALRTLYDYFAPDTVKTKAVTTQAREQAQVIKITDKSTRVGLVMADKNRKNFVIIEGDKNAKGDLITSKKLSVISADKPEDAFISVDMQSSTSLQIDLPKGCRILLNNYNKRDKLVDIVIKRKNADGNFETIKSKQRVSFK
jgi:hypothetical protein